LSPSDKQEKVESKKQKKKKKRKMRNAKLRKIFDLAGVFQTSWRSNNELLARDAPDDFGAAAVNGHGNSGPVLR
jgi:hypothetical protein